MLPHNTEPRVRKILNRSGRLGASQIATRMGMTPTAVANACRRMDDVGEVKIRGVRAPLFFMKEGSDEI